MARASMNRRQARAKAPGLPKKPKGLEDRWKSWIVENLLAGVQPQTLVDSMTAQQIPPAVATREVEAARTSPYLKGFERMANRLRKREWMLDVYGAHWRMQPGFDQVPRVETPSTDEFLSRFYALHRPCLITGALADWPACDRWTLDYLAAKVGPTPVEIQMGRSGDPAYERNSIAHKKTLPFTDFIAMMKKGETSNNYYCTANNASANRTALAPLWDDIGPLADYLVPTRKTEGFIWIGPKGTVTPFHHDLTNNFLVQIKGRKKVRLTSSYDMSLMRNDQHCFSQWTSADLPGGTPEPGKPQVIDCVIEPGEILFIPVGWWHHVEGLDMTFGASFTNFKWRNDWYASHSSEGPL